MYLRAIGATFSDLIFFVSEKMKFLSCNQYEPLILHLIDVVLSFFSIQHPEYLLYRRQRNTLSTSKFRGHLGEL